MRSVQLDFEDPAFPARLVERDDPELPSSEWARVAVTGGGVCGSDLHIFRPTTGPPTALFAYGTLPMELGHEIAGVVTQAGTDCPVPAGTRVAVDPVLGCAARGIDPWCDRCEVGAASICRNIGSRRVSEGMGIGFTHGLGGGWADALVAHPSQLHTIPDAVDARAETLPEPLSIAVHGLLRVPPADGPVLVIGAGIIGLLTTCAVRALLPGRPVVIVAKHPAQVAAAERCGADHVVELSDDVYGPLAEYAGTTVVGGGEGAMLAGGFPYVVEAVGSEAAVGQALRCVDSRGTVLLLGASGMSSVDLSPIWFKEASVSGSFCHAHDPAPPSAPSSTAADPSSKPGKRAHSFDVALDLLARGVVPADTLVTHEFPLADWRDALDVAMARDRGAIKVVLRP